MRFVSNSGKLWLAAAFGAFLSAGLGAFLHRNPIGVGLSYLSYDLLHVARGDIAVNEIITVYLDEPSHEVLGQKSNAPWDRRLHARLLDRLRMAGAKAVAFDIVFDEPAPDPAADPVFGEAIKRNGRVILAADERRGVSGGSKVDPPIDILLDSAADIGSARVLPDSDLTVRQHTTEITLPTLSWATASLLKAPITQQPDASTGERWLTYYARPAAMPGIAYYKALDPSLSSDDLFRDKVVFVGARMLTKFAGERKDEFRNPFSIFVSKGEQPFVAGVDIQATAFLNLLRGDWLSRLPGRWEKTIIVLFGLFFGAGLVLFRPTLATLLALGGACAAGIGAYLLFRKQLIWFPWLLLEVQMAAALSWSVLFNSIQLYVQKKLYEQTLVRYLSPKLVRKFSKDPGLLTQPAHKQKLTLFFSDIANFTSLSEGMDSDALSKLMNRYFETAVTQCIHKSDGTVVKYIGDAIFAFWNAPEDQRDHQARACQAALHFRDVEFHWTDGKLIRTRIGIHSGEANVGNFGSLDRVDYTALGENVNLASRVEGLNKYLGTTCLVTSATQEGVGSDVVSREIGLFRLKGFERPVQIFELVGWAAEAAASLPWRESFAEAVLFFKKHNLDKAEAAFRRTLELRPDDGPSKFYLTRIAELMTEPAPSEWTGEIELKEK